MKWLKSHFKRKSLEFNILWQVGVVIVLIGIVSSSVAYLITQKRLEAHLEHEVYSRMETMKYSFDVAQRANKSYENQQDQNLYYISKVLIKEISGRSWNQITQEELKDLAQEFGLDGISLFLKKDSDFFIVKQSSVKEEIGLDTQNWGYWNTAMNELYKKMPISIEKGWAANHYWIGPLSKSDWGNEYCKYAYYYDGSTDFLLNPYICDRKVLSLQEESSPSRLIEILLESNPLFLRDITIINAKRFITPDQDHEIIEPEFDEPILHGNHTYPLNEDQVLVSRVILDGKTHYQSFSHPEEGDLRKYYKLLSDGRVLTTVVDLDLYDVIYMKLLIVLSLSFIAIFLVCFMLIRLILKKQLEPVKNITAHLSFISQGDFSHTLDVKDSSELSFLAQEINRMSTKIRELIEEINRKAEDKIHYMAYHDALTSLPNRYLFMERLHDRLHSALEEQQAFAVMFLDLDQFKLVNDTLGHDAGDEFLVLISNRIKNVLREMDLLSRVGGDEFLVLIPSFRTRDELTQIAKRILHVFDHPFVIKGESFNVTTSIGISCFPCHSEEAGILITMADQAMYEAKRRGKNTFQFYEVRQMD